MLLAIRSLGEGHVAAVTNAFPVELNAHNRRHDAPLLCQSDLTCGGGAVPAMTFEVGVCRIGHRSMDLVAIGGHSLSVLSQVNYAWIDIEAEGLAIRPLVEIVSVTETTASVRFRHLFPRQQAALDAYNASN